jgi:tetratricopeptide (TPR) repeat protein
MKAKPTRSSRTQCAVLIVLTAAVTIGFIAWQIKSAPRSRSHAPWPGLIETTFSGDRAEPSRGLVSIARGYAALTRGDILTSTKEFLRARAADPVLESWPALETATNAVARLLAGDACIRHGELQKGLLFLEASVAEDPKLSVARAAREIALTITGTNGPVPEFPDVRGLENAIASQLLTGHAIGHLKANRVGLALMALEAALELEPENPVALNTRGVALARNDQWPEAVQNFELAFRLAHDLIEARYNWQAAQGARGALVASKWDRSEITLVTAADSVGLRDATATASEMVHRQWGVAPLITKDGQTALAMSRSGPIILQIPGADLKATAGERMLRELTRLKGKSELNVVCFGNESCNNATMGIIRHQNTTLPDQRAHIRSVHLLDPTELSGWAGKTPLGMAETKSLARRAAEISANGVSVAVFTTQDKWGIQHIGNVAAFREIKGVDLYVTPWKGSLETSVGVGLKDGALSAGLRIAQASDKASSRSAPGARDWTIFRHGVQQQQQGTLADFARRYLGPVFAGTTLTPRFNDRGGVGIGSTISTNAGARIVFDFLPARRPGLKLVYPIFGLVETIHPGRGTL